MNQPENRMTEALRRLNEMAPQSAPPALGERLREEFRRHHAGRKRNRIAQISLLAACLVAVFSLPVIFLRPHSAITVARHDLPQTEAPIEPVTARRGDSVILKPKISKARPVARRQKNQPAQGDRFVALPTYDPAIPVDHLQLVRLDLPGRALQLVGFPVSEEIAERRVVADILLAQDGTPYALRLIRSSQTKEQ